MNSNQMDAPLSPQHGPLTTIGRNVKSATAAIAGLVALVVPSVQGVPALTVIGVGGVGLALVAVFVANTVRWKGLVGRMTRAAVDAGASNGFAFMQAELAGAEGGGNEWMSPGWLLVGEDRLILSGQRASLGAGAPLEHRELRLADVATVFRGEPTSTTYAPLVVRLVSGGESSFTLAPRNGSGLRGPGNDEIDAAVSSIRLRLGAERVSDTAPPKVAR